MTKKLIWILCLLIKIKVIYLISQHFGDSVSWGEALNNSPSKSSLVRFIQHINFCFVFFCSICFISVLLWCSLFYSESLLTVKDENCSLSDVSRNQGQFAGKSHQSYIILNILHNSSVSLIRSSMIQTAINKVLKNGSYSIFYVTYKYNT